MNPAFSVILFTTLSGAGYGLLAWVGLALAFASPGLLDAGDPEWASWIFPRVMLALGTGLVLTAIGLSSSTFHLGKPMRAWRAFSQWRTSWLSREGVLALAAWIPALVLFAGCWFATRDPSHARWLTTGVVHACGALLAALSLLVTACTAMIYASLKPVPAWRHGLVVPVYLAFGLFSGLLLLAALMLLDWSDRPGEGFIVMDRDVPWIAGAFAVALAAMKLAYWRGIDRIALPSRQAATAMEGFGPIATFERPHTEANYLTREMGFVLARKHARKLRTIAVLLFAGMPLLMIIVAASSTAMAPASLWIATAAALAGAFVERWLFFAEARHMVTLYY